MRDWFPRNGMHVRSQRTGLHLGMGTDCEYLYADFILHHSRCRALDSLIRRLVDNENSDYSVCSPHSLFPIVYKQHSLPHLVIVLPAIVVVHSPNPLTPTPPPPGFAIPALLDVEVTMKSIAGPAQ